MLAMHCGFHIIKTESKRTIFCEDSVADGVLVFFFLRQKAAAQ